VVCLLLNKKDIAEKLMEELTGHVDEFIRAFKPVDALEWQIVLHEITKFLKVGSIRGCVHEQKAIFDLPLTGREEHRPSDPRRPSIARFATTPVKSKHTR
jgi:hypothetical protein